MKSPIAAVADGADSAGAAAKIASEAGDVGDASSAGDSATAGDSLADAPKGDPAPTEPGASEVSKPTDPAPATAKAPGSVEASASGGTDSAGVTSDGTSPQGGAGYAAEGVSVAAGEGAGSASASLVRTVASHETNPGLFNEMKGLTFESGQEHALVRYASGERAILSGGHTGISGLDDIEELIAHTHPYDIPAQGPSMADYTALNQLGQESSILLEHGLEIPFGVEDPMYLKLFGG